MGITPGGKVTTTGPNGKEINNDHFDDCISNMIKSCIRNDFTPLLVMSKMERQHINLSIHFEHPTLDLSSICSLLALRPTHIWKKGDERQTPTGTKIGGVRDNSYCSVQWDASPGEPLLKQIEAILAVLRPHRTVLRGIVSTGGLVCIYVGWFCNEHTGERFGWEILDAIADLQISLDLNIYVPDSPDAENLEDIAIAPQSL